MMDLQRNQQENPLCQLMLKALESKKPNLVLTESPKEELLVYREWDWLQWRDRVVY